MRTCLRDHVCASVGAGASVLCECVLVCLQARVRMVRAIHIYVRACVSVYVCVCGCACVRVCARVCVFAFVACVRRLSGY